MKCKKLLSLLLALVLALSCVGTAFAADASITYAAVQNPPTFVCGESKTQIQIGTITASGFYDSSLPTYSYTLTATVYDAATGGNTKSGLTVTFDNSSYSSPSSLKVYVTTEAMNTQAGTYYIDVTCSANSKQASLAERIPVTVNEKTYTLTSASNLAGGGVNFATSSGSSKTITSAKAGAEVYVTAIPVEGYSVVLSTTDATLYSALGYFYMPSKNVTVTATYTANNYAYLDLESSETYKDSKTVDQTYTLKQSGNTTYTDVTKVKLEWTLPEISASYTSNKTWNPDTMKWVESKTTAEISEKTAEFTFTNYSSVAVGAKVSFAKSIGVKSNYTTDVLTLESILNPDTHAQVYQSAPSGTITLTYTPVASEFNSLAAGTGTYGTYTVSLASAVKVTFDMQDHGTQVDAQYVGSGGKVTAPTAPTADGYTFDGWYENAECTGNAWNFTDNTVTANKTLYAKWTQQ